MKKRRFVSISLCFAIFCMMLGGIAVSAETGALINSDYENRGYYNIQKEGAKDWAWNSVSDGFLVISVSFMQPATANTRIHQVWETAGNKGSRPYILYTYADADRKIGNLTMQVKDASFNLGAYYAGQWTQAATIIDVENKKIYAYINEQMINPSTPFDYFQDTAGISALQMQMNNDNGDTYIDRVYVDRFCSMEAAKAALMTQTMINDSTDSEFTKTEKETLEKAAAPYLSALRESDNAEALAGLLSVTDAAIPKIRNDLFSENFEECTIGAEPTRNKVAFVNATVAEADGSKAVKILGNTRSRYTIAYQNASGANKEITENVTISFKFKQKGEDKAGSGRVTAATNSDGNSVAFELKSDGSNLYLYSYDESKELAKVVKNYFLDTWYKFDMNVNFVRKEISVYVDNKYAATVPFAMKQTTGIVRIMDANFWDGEGAAGTEHWFDDIRVYTETKTPDFAIGSSVYKNASGEVTSKLMAGGILESTYIHKNAAGAAKLYSTAYKGGKLSDIKVSDVAEGTAGEIVKVDVNLAVGDSAEDFEIRQFIWNNDMMPVAGDTFKTASADGATIFLVGDSTVATYNREEEYPIAGWGQMLGKYLPGIEIKNYAISGYTLKRTYNEGILQKALEEGKPGDYLMIQFAHNDSKLNRGEYVDAVREYRAWLKLYAEEAMANGMYPLFVTSPTRRVYASFGGDAVLASYSDAMKSVGRALHVPVIDLLAESKQIVACYDSGEVADVDSKTLYLYLQPHDPRYFGENSQYVNSRYNSDTATMDDTHFCEYGADIMAGIVANGIKELNNELSAWVDTSYIPMIP